MSDEPGLIVEQLPMIWLSANTYHYTDSTLARRPCTDKAFAIGHERSALPI